MLKDAAGNKLEPQVNFVWNGLELLVDRLEICFLTSLRPLSINQYSIETSPSQTYPYSQVELFHFDEHISELFISNVNTPGEIELDSKNLKLTFGGADGMLRRVSQLENGVIIKSHSIKAQFMTYGTKTGRNEQKSGAYLFIPG